MGYVPSDATLFRKFGEASWSRCPYPVGSHGNSVDVNENEYAVSSFEARLAAVRKLETFVENGGFREQDSDSPRTKHGLDVPVPKED